MCSAVSRDQTVCSCSSADQPRIPHSLKMGLVFTTSGRTQLLWLQANKSGIFVLPRNVVNELTYVI